MFFSMGGIFPIYEGLHKLMNPEMPESPWIAVGVLVFAVLLELASFDRGYQCGRDCSQEKLSAGSLGIY
jgi:divalent metal cation (Fe/Co/Zn/Cd) transporter